MAQAVQRSPDVEARERIFLPWTAFLGLASLASVACFATKLNEYLQQVRERNRSEARRSDEPAAMAKFRSHRAKLLKCERELKLFYATIGLALIEDVS